jgi:hypothetical protein
MTTYTEAMQTQYEKVQTYLRQTETTKPVAFHELKRLWDIGGSVCDSCHSTNYRNCVTCATSGVYTPHEPESRNVHKNL